MKNVEIRRPGIEDKAALHEFFREVLEDTYAREGLAELQEDIKEEIETKKAYLERDYESSGKKRYFLIALDNGRIVGTIEYGPSSELIVSCTDGALKELVEIGTVFVHPEYQRQGVGNMLLNEMYKTLLNKGIEEFCLDSGYTNAQKIWKKKFGEPDYLIKDYWGEGFDHMIWRVRIKDVYKV